MSISFFGKIQDKDEAYYMQFKIVICGLDSIEARRWINATLVSMASAGESEDSFKPLIDGGTEGDSSFKGVFRIRNSSPLSQVSRVNRALSCPRYLRATNAL